MTHFPRQTASQWRSGQEAVLAGRLSVHGGCLTLVSEAGASPIVWHPEARLSDDGRRVIDTRTGREAAVGDAVALAGGMRARAEVSAREAQAWNLSDHCTGDSILLAGVGFHEQDNR